MTDSVSGKPLVDPLGLLKRETARWEPMADGQCPAQGCTLPMQIATANGVTTYVCVTHRVCLPKENP